MKPRELIPLCLAAIGLVTAAVERMDGVRQQETTGYVDASLRACMELLVATKLKETEG